MMESTLFSRLGIFMQHKGLNDNKITIQAKIAVGTLGKQRRSGKGLSYDSLVKILTTYPELNPSWLILGKGEMILKEDDTPTDLKEIIEIIVKQDAIVKKQQEKIDLLISQSDYLRTQIAINQNLLQTIANKEK